MDCIVHPKTMKTLLEMHPECFREVDGEEGIYVDNSGEKWVESKEAKP